MKKKTVILTIIVSVVFAIISYHLFDSIFSKYFIVDRVFFGTLSFYLWQIIPYYIFYSVVGVIISMVFEEKSFKFSIISSIFFNIYLLAFLIYYNSLTIFLSLKGLSYFFVIPFVAIGTYFGEKFINKLTNVIHNTKFVNHAVLLLLIFMISITTIYQTVNLFSLLFSDAYKFSINYSPPIYPEAYNIEKYKNRLRGGQSVVYYVDVTYRSIKVLDYYKGELKKEGWTIKSNNEIWHEGVVGYKERNYKLVYLIAEWENTQKSIVSNLMITYEISNEAYPELLPQKVIYSIIPMRTK